MGLGPDFFWRLAATIAIAATTIAIVVWVGRWRRRLAKHDTAGTDPGKRPPGRLAHTLLALALFGGATWVILEIWRIDAAAYLAPQSGSSVRSLVRVLIIIAIAAVGLELTDLASRKLIERLGERKGDRRRIAKLRTITPLISGLAHAIILLVATAMVLSEVGVEIAPLLAGAGIAGIAIGFGAQSLVKDLFTGAFLIIEDIVSHGDIVDISGVTGTVEAMTLRTIRVRSFDGTLHIFPYGEAQVIHNKTSRYSCFAFELQVSYLSDIDQAINTLVKVGDELEHDREMTEYMLAPLEISGVDKLADTGVILKGRIRTTAGDQARVGSAFLKLVKERLDEAGILIAHRHQPVPPFDWIQEQVEQPPGPAEKRRAPN
jgi:small conductance mechanosensitive channel